MYINALVRYSVDNVGEIYLMLTKSGFPFSDIRPNDGI